ncbi:hypothetical protein KSZ_77010 [Dictyobacter formicarum]|uniref:Uncharacterized protein n=1 Tax=Dictyobacter formicarum TaxID=2778368 RepID=A0ABQ3VTZ1_9CHLR|nr:hypothetical protein KSZ_77010 [Dictyobacter formicarum]
MIQGPGSEQAPGEPGALFLDRRQTRTIEGEDMKNNAGDIKNHLVVSHEEWLSARKALLAREKELTRLDVYRLKRSKLIVLT